MIHYILTKTSGSGPEEISRGGIKDWLNKTCSFETADTLTRQIQVGEAFFDEGCCPNFLEIFSPFMSAGTAFSGLHALDKPKIKETLSKCSGDGIFLLHSVDEIFKNSTEPAFDEVAKKIFGPKPDDAAGARFALSSGLPSFTRDKGFLAIMLNHSLSSGTRREDIYVPTNNEIKEINAVGPKRYFEENFKGERIINLILEFNQKLKKYEHVKNYREK